MINGMAASVTCRFKGTCLSLIGSLWPLSFKFKRPDSRRAAGTLPPVSWSRQIEIDPCVRGFKLQFHEADFKRE